MALSQLEINRVIAAANSLPLDAPEVPIEDFFGSTLGLNAAQQAAAFPDPDPTAQGAIAISRLTHTREVLLREKCEVPNFVVYEGGHKRTYIAGLCTYLLKSHPPDFVERIRLHKQIRSELISIDKGHKLETVAAALLAAACVWGEATRGSGDQGIDAIGWNKLIEIEEAFLDGALNSKTVRPGHKVMIIASSKAVIGTGAVQKIINPAHIRELVGGWLIQRSEIGMWRNMGVQMLTPLQLVLVTTYRLSEDSKAECQNLGVQVWGIPELVFLICRYAPPEVFRRAGRIAFSVQKFTAWWQAKDLTRVTPMVV